MTRAKISEYSATAGDNTDVNGINIAEGCPPSSMNNMGREIMAALKRFQVGSDGDGVTVGGSLVVSGSTSVNTFNVDVISEKTSAAGVTVDGVLLKDSQVSTDQINEKTSATGVTVDGVLLKDSGVVTGAGTVSAPVYSTTGDLNTGIYFPAADVTAITTGGTERARIDASGRFLIPFQPSFRARTNTSTANTGATSVFQFQSDSATGCFDNGSVFNTTNYRFTAPVAGKYLLSAHIILIDYPVNNSVEAAFQINGSTALFFDRQSKTYNVANRYSLGGSTVANLSANDYVDIICYADTASGWSYEASSNFSGFLIG